MPKYYVSFQKNAYVTIEAEDEVTAYQLAFNMNIPQASWECYIEINEASDLDPEDLPLYD
jgi:hypothetical protein